MKTLILTWEYPPRNVGGLARHVFHLASEMAALGVDVHVLTLGDREEDSRTEEGVRVHRIVAGGPRTPNMPVWALQMNFRLLQKAVRLFGEEGGFDVVHLHDWLVGPAGWTLKGIYGRPLVATIHATERGRNRGLHNEWQEYVNDIEWWVTYEAWRVICCSRYMKGELMGNFTLPEDKIEVIPNGVDPRYFAVGERAGTDASQRERLVFFVGRLMYEKGVDVLIKAAPAVLREVPDVRFVVAGAGPAEGWLKGLVAERRLGDRFDFTGYIEDERRNELYHRAMVSVVPSIYEPFGMVALESMACRTPVIVSDTGGLSEIVRHGRDGLKVAPGDPASLASALVRILVNPGLWRRLSSGGFTRASHYSWPWIANRTLALYRDVLEMGGQSADEREAGAGLSWWRHPGRYAETGGTLE